MTSPLRAFVNQSAPPRLWRWLKARRLTCARGHPFSYTFRVHERSAHRCHHWDDASRSECGRWTYFIAIRGGGVIAADVTLDEVNTIDKMETGTEVIDFLEIFPT